MKDKNGFEVPKKNTLLFYPDTRDMGYSTGELNEAGNLEMTRYPDCVGYLCEDPLEFFNIVRLPNETAQIEKMKNCFNCRFRNGIRDYDSEVSIDCEHDMGSYLEEDLVCSKWEIKK